LAIDNVAHAKTGYPASRYVARRTVHPLSDDPEYNYRAPELNSKLFLHAIHLDCSFWCSGLPKSLPQRGRLLPECAGP